MTQEHGYFDPQSRQVEPGELRAFGVTIHSRRGRAGELCEMLRFVQDAATLGAAEHLKRVHFDSDSGVCHIDVDDRAPLHGSVEHRLNQAARKHLSRFTLCGANELGETLGSQLVSQPAPEEWSTPEDAVTEAAATDDSDAISPTATSEAPELR
ncbi:MAG: hypothetical protein AWU55_3093 [Halomonadaceae bacterium T82-2]|nr:MAG: hypothetical protein AWU55_3093 [Halomonadaceae bacterium T82-2]